MTLQVQELQKYVQHCIDGDKQVAVLLAFLADPVFNINFVNSKVKAINTMETLVTKSYFNLLISESK